jgi:hypothetical protein
MKNYVIGALVLLSIILGGITYYQHRKLSDVQVITHTDTVTVETVQYDTIYPTPITLIETIYDTITITGEYSDVGDLIGSSPTNIVTDYFATRHYDDVLKDDSAGYSRSELWISQNRLIDRKFYFQARSKDKVITNYVSEPEFYLMPSIMLSVDGLGLESMFVYRAKNKRLYGLKVGVMQNPYVGIGYGFVF